MAYKAELSSDEWGPGETIKPDGKVRMPEGFDLVVYRSDSPSADETDPQLRRLEFHFPPPQVEASTDNTQP